MFARLIRTIVVATAVAGFVAGCASPPPKPDTMRDSSVRNFTEGTLVVHAIDTARNVEVWQGRVSGKMTKGSVEPAAINQAVALAMADFPVR